MPHRLIPKHQISFRDKSSLLRYSMAFCIGLTLSSLHLSCFDSLSSAPYLLFYPFLFLISTILGFGPAVFFLVLVGVERNFISMAPELLIHAPNFKDLIQFIIMGLSSFIVIWIIDNNQTKEVEKTTFENENKLVTFFETISDIAWTATAKGVVDFYNKRWYEFTGLTGRETEAPSWELALHPVDRFNVVERWKANIKSGQALKMECRFKDKKSNNYKWFLVHAQPVKNKKGQVLQWMGTCTDIDEQKKAQEILRKKGEEFKIITETIPQAIWRTNPDGSADYFSRKFYEIVGYANEDYRGWAWLSIIHPEDSERVEAEMRYYHDQGVPFSIECRILGEDKVYRWFILMGNPLFEESTLVNYYLTLTNIQAQKQIEKEILSTLRSKDEFINIASHELKTPLTSLKLQTQMIQRALDKGDPTILTKEKVSQFSYQVIRSITKLHKLVEDMLDFSRIRMDKFSIQPELIRLDEVLKESLHKAIPQFIQEKAEVPRIQKIDAIKGNWDRIRLEQVFNNLLINALKYGRKKPVVINLEKRENTALFSIKDEGMGIKEDHMPKIFDRFERGISASEVSGLGLGLFISRQIIEAQGGKIWAESEENKGSVFYIELPLNEEQ